MELCYKCGKAIKLECAHERVGHLFEDNFYCDECEEKIGEEFDTGD